ncbi:hypothetical protein [Sinorhizobium sp. M4_45]|uniref:flagellin N-terminal helical domain-containing protein n=1 Tax=Sinorhizobium sp. M4_45 TaxID=2037901 RepID=UPI000C9A19C8|nr:hypothetical protein [Sinorhizobium sp. M4_45]PND27043.1 hypothetical protein CN933_15145 [Sinorhizobium sp. M4_45]
MTSIHINSGATAALQILRAINANLTITQKEISSGLRVGAAADNAAYWSISTTMRSDNMALFAIVDALGLAAAETDVAYTGLQATIGVLDGIKAKLVAAKEEGVDRQKIQAELEQLIGQAESIATSASFNGVNWLNTHIADLSPPPPSRCRPRSAARLPGPCRCKR